MIGEDSVSLRYPTNHPQVSLLAALDFSRNDPARTHCRLTLQKRRARGYSGVHSVREAREARVKSIFSTQDRGMTR